MSSTTARPGHPRRTRPARARAGLGRVVLSRTRVELLQFFRQRESLVFNFLFPIILMAIFSTVFGSADLGDGVTFAQYFLPGIAAAGVLLTSFQALAIDICIERDNGTLKRLRATPMPPTAYFLGKVGQVLVTTVLQLALLLAFARVAYGVPLPDTSGDWLRFAWVVALGSAVGTVAGIAYSSLPPNGRSATALVTPPLLVLQFISGVFFQYDQIPEGLRAVASVFPLKWLAQGLRSVFLPDSFQQIEPDGSWQTTETALVLLLWLVAGLVLARFTFRWLPKRHG